MKKLMVNLKVRPLPYREEIVSIVAGLAILLLVKFLTILYAPLYAETVAGKNNIKALSSPEPAKIYYPDTEKRQELPDSVIKLLKKYKIPQDDLSVYVRNLNAENALIEHNIDKLRSPASTMKLLTTYAALKELGPNYSWRTEVWMRGEMKQGILTGDLILKGFGDPFLVYENFWKLLATLRDMGLREINGDLVVDNSYFSLPKHDPAAFDNKPFRIYNAAPSALMFNFQATRFLFSPQLPENSDDGENKSGQSDKKKKQAKARSGSVNVVPFPAISNFKFDNQIKLTSGRCRKSHYQPRFSRDKAGKLAIKGNYSTNCKQQFILRAVTEPQQLVFNAFRDIWSDLKGKHNGGFRVGNVQNSDERFYVYSSPSLGAVMRLINKWSNNVMTRQLLLTLGAKKLGAPGTLAKGQQAILEILSDNNINTTGIRIENGSGLSRNSRITVKQMGQLLETAYRDAYMPEFIASLALPGIDGTLVNRFRNEDLRGRSHFKTGTLTGVSAIAGYMLNRQGKRLVIVVMLNGKRIGGGRSRKIQDALLRWSFEQ